MSDEPVTEAAPPPSTGGQPPSRSSNGLAIVGWIAAVIIPLPIGLVIGAILASRDDKRGRWILGVAVVMSIVMIVYLVELLHVAEHRASNDYYNSGY